MSFLRLCRNLFSQSKLGEMVLLFQLVCMICFSFAVLNPVDSFFKCRRELVGVYGKGADEMIHFGEGNAVFVREQNGDFSSSEEVYRRICGIQGVDSVLRFRMAGGLYAVQDSAGNTIEKVANLLIYSETMMETVNLKLEKGAVEESDGETVFLLVSPSLEKQMPVGARKDLEIGLSGEKISCVVAGVLSDSAIASITSYGSKPELGALGTFSEERKIVDFAIAYGNDDLFSKIGWGANCIIVPRAGADCAELLDSLRQTVGIYGELETVENIIRKSFVAMLKDNAWNVLTFALLFLIAIFGYGGYLFLMIRQRMTEFSVYYILGMTRKKMTGIIFVSGAMMLSLAFFLATLITPAALGKIFQTEIASPGMFSYLFCGAVLMIILLLSVLSGFGLTGKLEEAMLYKEGD